MALSLELLVGPRGYAVPDVGVEPDAVDAWGGRAGPTNNFGEGGRNKCGGVCPEFVLLLPVCEYEYDVVSEGEAFSTVGGSATSRSSSTMTGVVLSSGDMEYPC